MYRNKIFKKIFLIWYYVIWIYFVTVDFHVQLKWNRLSVQFVSVAKESTVKNMDGRLL